MISILYDGQCGLCRRAIRTLQRLDWLKKLTYVNFQNDADHMRVAPEISYDALNRSMHVKFEDGSSLEGFYAFRAIAWRLPLTWILAPFLYIPGVPAIGKRVYAHIAESRKKCTHESCGI